LQGKIRRFGVNKDLRHLIFLLYLGNMQRLYRRTIPNC
jgi:hypothetical protein